MKVEFTCESCGAAHRSDFKHLNKRKVVMIALCPKCVMRALADDAEWRAKNSAAQKIAQVRPETLRKNAEGVSRFWRENPDKLEQMRLSVMAAQQTETTKLKYRARSGYNGRGIAGVYLSKWSWLPFDSSYELAFIVQLESREDIRTLKRGPTVAYLLDGIEREYMIDYAVTYMDGRVEWIEVKSGFIGTKVDKIEKLTAKFQKAIELVREGHADRFRIVTEKNSVKDFGFKMPRGTYRKALFKRLASKIIFQSLEKETLYNAA